jgi:hypothetical protein
MEEKFFPKRIKLKVKFKGSLEDKTQEIFLFTNMKSLRITEDWYKTIYKPEVIEFVQVPGIIEIIDKPKELMDSLIAAAPKLEDVFEYVPEFALEESAIWGRGFENTLYVADKNFKEVVKLKKYNEKY